MCDCEITIDVDMENYLLEGEEGVLLDEKEVPLLPMSRRGDWDILVLFGIGDEEVLEHSLELPVAKVLILDHYADVYKHEDCQLVIRRQRRTEWVHPKKTKITKGNSITYLGSELDDAHHEIDEIPF